MKIVLLSICLLSHLSAINPDLEEVFTNVYKTDMWNSWPETVSGEGSTLACTKKIRKMLPLIFKQYNIKTILDLPCGDFNWLKEVDLTNITYHGGDIVQEIVESNQERYGKENITFSQMDASLPITQTYDLIICRDLLLHLSNANIKKVLKNIKASNAKYLLISSHPGAPFTDLPNSKETGHCRYVDLSAAEYNIGEPLLSFYDDFTYVYPKDMILFKIND